MTQVSSALGASFSPVYTAVLANLAWNKQLPHAVSMLVTKQEVYTPSLTFQPQLAGHNKAWYVLGIICSSPHW